MRILLWSSTFWPHIGGVEVLGANLVTALVERGHQVVVLARRDTDDLPAMAEIGRASVVRLRFRQAVESQDPDAVLALRGEVGRIKRALVPDIVHLYHLGPDLLFHRLTAAAHPAPALVTLHQPFSGDLLAANAALGRTLREADAIAACSRSVLEDLRARIPLAVSRSHLVVNALPPSAVAASPLADGPPVVLFVGRVVPQKGFDLGLQAFAQVVTARPDARLVIAGDGIARAELERQAGELGIAGAVELAGWAAAGRVRELMRAARLVAMPSRYEPFGLVALEAAQMRRPVVGFAVDGLPEAVADGRSGILVEPGNVDALAAAMLRLLDDRALAARLGDGGHERARSAAGWDAHVTAYERIYQRLAGHG
jgi:glycogen synthase